MRFSEIKAKAVEMEINIELALWCHLRFLRRLMIEEVEQMDHYLNQDNELADLFYQDSFDRFMKLAEESKSLALAPTRKQPLQNEVTADMIHVARNADITTLINFDRYGKALAFCHEDKRPSLSYNPKKNRAHCFPCGKSFDPIGVLTARDNMTFLEAVRALAQ